MILLDCRRISLGLVRRYTLHKLSLIKSNYGNPNTVYHQGPKLEVIG